MTAREAVIKAMTSEFASLPKSGHAEAHILSANTALCRITPAGKQALKDSK